VPAGELFVLSAQTSLADTDHRRTVSQNIQAWQEAQVAVEAIEPHPNRPPPPSGGLSPPLAKRSDTAVTIRPEIVVAAEREVDTAAAVPLPLPDTAETEVSDWGGVSGGGAQESPRVVGGPL
jgi:hypothetical protein